MYRDCRTSTINSKHEAAGEDHGLHVVCWAGRLRLASNERGRLGNSGAPFRSEGTVSIRFASSRSALASLAAAASLTQLPGFAARSIATWWMRISLPLIP